MSLGNRRTPERQNPLLSGLVIEQRPAVTNVLTTGGGAETLTTAELLSGLLTPDTQDAQTWNTPTAAQINAAIPGVKVGDSFDVDIINYGDSTLTIGLGTGVTKVTIAGVSAVLTLATLVSKRLRFVCTGVKLAGDASDAWVVYGFGSVAAAVA